MEVTSKCGVKRTADDNSYNTRKRVKFFNCFHNEDLEVKLKDLSGNMCTLREKKTGQVNVSKKVDVTSANIPMDLLVERGY